MICLSAPPPNLKPKPQQPAGLTFQALIQVLQHHSDDLHDGQDEGTKGQRAGVVPKGQRYDQWLGLASPAPSFPNPQPTQGPT